MATSGLIQIITNFNQKTDMGTLIKACYAAFQVNPNSRRIDLTFECRLWVESSDFQWLL